MNSKQQQPADERLTQLYQQRKAGISMPDSLRDDILKQAGNSGKKPFWRSPPVWSATLAACFVMVISVKFLPQSQQELEMFDVPKSSQSSQMPPPPVEVQQSSEKVMQPTMASTPQRAQFDKVQLQSIENKETEESSNEFYYQQDIAESTATIESELSTYESIKTSSLTAIDAVEVQAEQFQGQTKSRMSAQGAQVPEQTMLAPAKTMKRKAPVQLVKAEVRLKQNNQSELEVISCNGDIIELAPQYLQKLKANQWIAIRYNLDNKIEQVNTIKDFKGCENE